MSANPKKTKIVFTIGPATQDEAVLERLFAAGVNVCRINAAHADCAAIQAAIRKIQKLNEKLGTFVSTMVDIKGPEIRTGEIIEHGEQNVELKSTELTPGQELYIVIGAAPKLPVGMLSVGVNYPGIVDDVTLGQKLLLDNGLIELEIIALNSDGIGCKVLIGGHLGQKRHLNLPGVYIRLPSITDKDRSDSKAAVEAGVDFIALSFVRCARDVMTLRSFLGEIGSNAKIIAKIEDHSGVRNLEEIVKAADSIMVARGDLGIETPIEQIPREQARMTELCKRYAKPVVIATHMLESMIQSPIPTRAEVSDIAHAVSADQADAIMLSGETGVGKYPVECVQMMARVACSEEAYALLERQQDYPLRDTKERLIAAAADLALSVGGAPIMVFTRDGLSAKLLSSLRPGRCHLYACTDSASIAREMSLYWGVEPVYLELGDHQMTEEFAINAAIRKLSLSGNLTDGQSVVVLAKTKVTQANGRESMVDSLHVRKVYHSQLAE